MVGFFLSSQGRTNHWFLKYGANLAGSFISSGFKNSNYIFILTRSEIENKKRFSIPKENSTKVPVEVIFDVDIVTCRKTTKF